MKLKYFLFAFCVCFYFGEMKAQSHFRTFKQPDGTTFQAVEKGDEWLRFYETPEGYILRKSGGRYFHYHTINEDGEFVSLNKRAALDLPTNVPKQPYLNEIVKKALLTKVNEYNRGAEQNRKRFLKMQREGKRKLVKNPVKK